ncbi:MAG: STAS domain-containing protein [Planctomycetota bacterium]
MAASIEHEDRDGVRWILVDGELDYVDADEAGDAILAALDVGVDGAADHAAQRVVLDLSAVGFLGSAGIRILIQSWKRVSERGGEFSVTGMSATAQRVFTTTGLDGIIPQLDE